MFISQQFKLCYCPVAMKNIILEYEQQYSEEPKCLNAPCCRCESCPYLRLPESVR